MRRTTITWSLYLIGAIVLIVFLYGITADSTSTDNSYMDDATYVGSDNCAICHSDQHTAWADSLHPTKIRIASSDTIVPDFDDTKVTLSLSDIVEVTVTLSVENGDYYAKLDDTDTYKYKISHVLGGVGWKQRYLTEDIGNSKYILPMQWNLETNGWVAYHSTDWYDADTGAVKEIEKKQSWDRRCLGCHTTGGEITYTGDEWIGTYNELGIGCEGCHGPGSEHNGDISKIWKSDDSALCGNCHNRGSSIDSLGGQTMGYPVNEAGKIIQPGDDISDYYVDGAGYHEDGETSRQHHQQYPDYLKNPQHSENNIECITCHDSHGTDIEHDLKISKETICTQCHSAGVVSPGDTVEMPHSEIINGDAPISGVTGTAWMDGKVTCTDCHLPKVAKSAVNYDIASHTNYFISPQKSIDYNMPNSCTVRCHDGTNGEAMTDQEAIDYLDENKSEIQTKLISVNAKLATAKGKLDDASGDVDSETESYNEAVLARDFVQTDGTNAHNPAYALELLNYAESTADEVINSLESSEGTPGFEAIAFIIALGAALIIFRKRKK